MAERSSYTPSGLSRENQGRDRVGIVEGSCGYRAHGVSIRENSFYQEACGTRRGGGGRHVAKCSSDSQQRYATGELVRVQGRDRVGIVVGYCG